MVFAVIYRSYIKKDKELQYQSCWKTLADFFVKEKGAIGSTLHKSEEGLWIAYSKWPNQKTRDQNWSKNLDLSQFPPEIQKCILTLKDCMDDKKSLPEICMEVVEEVSAGF